MPQNFKTTFIPQGGASDGMSQAPQPTTGDSIRVRQTVSILTIVATLSVIVSLLSIGGVYVLEKSLTQRIAQMEVQLETAEKQFEPTLIVKLKQLDERLNQASNVLRSHRSVAPLFDVLNATTSKNVQYDTLHFEFNEDGFGTVEIEGQARSYQAIAQQSKKLSEQNIIQDHIFSEFELQDSGRVRFALLVTLSSDALLFENVIQQGTIGGEVMSADSVEMPNNTIPSSVSGNASSLDTNIFISS